ncbi:MAG TPA: cob(I)yrinic acid a,c-diamide adenosyltransferase [Acidimicrobiales bacterium]|nr:cob(I)yrinic acid a,c-diamide adenosyltransferase [Acidimicrobiales bacterium]
MRIYTRRGDDGTTSLRGGRRVAKSSALVEALGALDEAQAALGVARAECARPSALEDLLVGFERDLWVVMAEVAGPPVGDEGTTAASTVTPEMVLAVESAIDARAPTLGGIRGFALPGENRLAAALDAARTAVRRAERRLAALELAGDGHVLAYVNRLSDLCWALARESEEVHLPARGGGEKGRDDRGG